MSYANIVQKKSMAFNILQHRSYLCQSLLNSFLISHQSKCRSNSSPIFRRNKHSGPNVIFPVFLKVDGGLGSSHSVQSSSMLLPFFSKLFLHYLKSWSNQHSSSGNLPHSRFTMKPVTVKFQAPIPYTPKVLEVARNHRVPAIRQETR